MKGFFNKRTFTLKIDDENVKQYYKNHSTFHEGDAGLDLFITEDISIEPGETKLIDFGVQCQSRSKLPFFCRLFCKDEYKYYSYWLVPRSSISKTTLIMRNSVGLIDEKYTGNIKAPLYNTSMTETCKLNKGQRIVQLVNGNLGDIRFEIVEELRQTSRTAGFGSTGN